MGQRHQIFIKTLNPVWVLTQDKSLNYITTPQMREMFGSGKFTILAYHNQWLFGRSPLHMALNVLNFAAQFTNESKTSFKSYEGDNSPFTPYGIRSNFQDVDEWLAAINAIVCYRPTNTEYLMAGFWHNHFLNKDQPEMREDFRLGDNNDGITIIDTIENKYCFMNIYRQSTEPEYSVSDLPMLVPCTAEQYVRAYRGETIASTNPYYIQDLKMGDTPAKVVRRAKKINYSLTKQFKPYQLLTVAELGEMFPKIKDLVEANQPAYE